MLIHHWLHKCWIIQYFFYINLFFRLSRVQAWNTTKGGLQEVQAYININVSSLTLNLTQIGSWPKPISKSSIFSGSNICFGEELDAIYMLHNEIKSILDSFWKAMPAHQCTHFMLISYPDMRNYAIASLQLKQQVKLLWTNMHGIGIWVHDLWEINVH